MIYLLFIFGVYYDSLYILREKDEAMSPEVELFKAEVKLAEVNNKLLQ